MPLMRLPCSRRTFLVSPQPADPRFLARQQTGVAPSLVAVTLRGLFDVLPRIDWATEVARRSDVRGLMRRSCLCPNVIL